MNLIVSVDGLCDYSTLGEVQARVYRKLRISMTRCLPVNVGWEAYGIKESVILGGDRCCVTVRP